MVTSSYCAHQRFQLRDRSFCLTRFAENCDIRAGDPLDASVENGRIVLTPRRTRAHRVRIVTDPVTGLPALSAGADAPALTSKDVLEILANFP